MPTHGDLPVNQTSIRLEECVRPFKEPATNSVVAGEP
jgi:hypothetical protein